MSRKPKNALKISQLAQAAGVPPATVKHYLAQGLLPKPVKTGKTMAWYDLTCVDRIRIIKKLQREKFMPLDLIRRVIDAGADLETEVEIGRVIARYERLDQDPEPVPERALLASTGAAPEDLRYLERLGLIEPLETPAGRQYDPADRKVVELALARRSRGLTLEYAAGIMKIYAQAVKTAVRRDVGRFLSEQVEKVDARQALRLMTEADRVLDEFIILYRHREQRALARQAFRDFERLRGLVDRINVLPVNGRRLPAVPPEEGFALYHLLAGNYPIARKWAEAAPGLEPRALVVFCALALGEAETAAALVERFFPEPTGRPLVDACAALALAAGAATAAGFSRPVRLARRAVAFLETRPGAGFEAALFRYVQGAVYRHLPELYSLRKKGRAFLEKSSESAGDPDFFQGLPGWAVPTIEHELWPAIRLRAETISTENFIEKGVDDAGRNTP